MASIWIKVAVFLILCTVGSVYLAVGVNNLKNDYKRIEASKGYTHNCQIISIDNIFKTNDYKNLGYDYAISVYFNAYMSTCANIIQYQSIPFDYKTGFDETSNYVCYGNNYKCEGPSSYVIQKVYYPQESSLMTIYIGAIILGLTVLTYIIVYTIKYLRYRNKNGTTIETAPLFNYDYDTFRNGTALP